jgi:hypothetical protein
MAWFYVFMIAACLVVIRMGISSYLNHKYTQASNRITELVLALPHHLPSEKELEQIGLELMEIERLYHRLLVRPPQTLDARLSQLGNLYRFLPDDASSE